MISHWYIAHQTTGRTRLRAQQYAKDIEALLATAATITAFDGIDQVVPKSMTGSLIIEHEELPWTQLHEQLQANGIVIGEPPPVAPGDPLKAIAAFGESLNQGLTEYSDNRVNMQTLMFGLVMVAAAVQISRGQIFGSAATLLWHGYEMVRRSTEVNSNHLQD
ncbi:MAG: hypothetical protein PVG66_07200 [Chromatiales bacterium]|jgi:hypothetical protein